jgi:uncharacterized membrane protein
MGIGEDLRDYLRHSGCSSFITFRLSRRCVLFIVLTFGIGILIAWLPLAIVGLWFVYRIVRGCLRLRDGRPMYM